MQSLRTAGRVLRNVCLVAVSAAALAGVSASGAWLPVSPDEAAVTASGPATPVVRAVDHGAGGIDVTVEVGGLNVDDWKGAGGAFVLLSWPNSSFGGAVGEPTLPVVRRLFVVPLGASVEVSVTAGQPRLVNLAAAGYRAAVVPVQAPVPMGSEEYGPGPFAQNQASYALDAMSPGERAVVVEVGIARGQRLYQLEVRPVAYNPVTGLVAIWPRLEVGLRFRGGAGEFGEPGLESDFGGALMNARGARVSGGRPGGRFVIVAAEAYATTAPMTQFVNAKTAQGYTVTLQSMAAGVTNTEIKQYLQGLWDSGDHADYLLLVGDTDTIPLWIGGGARASETDLPYTCMDGAADWYPEYPVSRFSARSTAQLQATVAKTLYVEGGVYTDPNYPRRAIFAAANDYRSGDEDTHNWVIDTYMVPNDYLVDKQYMRTMGATLGTLIASINAGSGYLIYFGHSGPRHWMGFSLEYSAVQTLSNYNKYPIVAAFSCVSGQLSVTECLGETFMVYPNIGACAHIGASNYTYATTYPWIETTYLEWSLFDAIYVDNKLEIGPAWQGCLVRYLNRYGPTHPVVRDYYEMFGLLGDPSLPVPYPTGFRLRANPEDQDVCAPPATEAQFSIDVEQVLGYTEPVTLSVADAPPGATVTFSLNDVPPPFTSTLTVDGLTGMTPGVHQFHVTGTSGTKTRSAPLRLGVFSGVPADVTLSSPANGSSVAVTKPTFTWLPAAQAQQYQLQLATDPNFAAVVCDVTVGQAEHTLTEDLEPFTQYWWHVRGLNACGSGNYSATWNFLQSDRPNYYTQWFDGVSSSFDLDYRTAYLVPDGSLNYYRLCVEPAQALPTDPNGSTALSLSDDSSVLVTPSQGVSFFGVPYSSFWVNANGNITFNTADEEWQESLPAHFNQPRISAVFDDLTPPTASSVSWREMSDRVAVSWVNVRQLNLTDSNTFQIELFFNGRIRITWLRVDANDCIAGVSPGGGVPVGFQQTDVSGIGTCACRGDCNCDHTVGFLDIDLFVAAIPNNQANWAAKYEQFHGTPPPPSCWESCDVNGNGNVGFDDIDPFVRLIPSACPP